MDRGPDIVATTYRVYRFAQGLCRDPEQRENVLAAPVEVKRPVLLRYKRACRFKVFPVCHDVFDVGASGVVVVDSKKLLVCGRDSVFVLLCGVIKRRDCFCPPVNKCVKVDLQ